MSAEAITVRAPSSVLRSRPLAALFTAEVLSTTGSQMTWLALSWFVLVTTGSKQMAFVIAAEAVGYALFGIPSGSLLARLGPQRTMRLCDAVRAPLMLLVSVLHWAGRPALPRDSRARRRPLRGRSAARRSLPCVVGSRRRARQCRRIPERPRRRAAPGRAARTRPGGAALGARRTGSAAAIAGALALSGIANVSSTRRSTRSSRCALRAYGARQVIAVAAAGQLAAMGYAALTTLRHTGGEPA